MPYDFDILEEASRLKPEYYLPMICEGFGFIAIGKSKDDQIILACPNNDEEDTVTWKPYEDVIK
jgi:hypothetical protein